MASIRERIETVFAALAFAEQNLDQEARDILEQTQSEKSVVANTAKRADSRPRLRA
jgi:hypothetical protein